MIFGVGTDLVQVGRIEATYARFGEHFVERLLMPEERALFDPGRRPARFLAMRFAAKEAIAKALGTWFRHGVSGTVTRRAPCGSTPTRWVTPGCAAYQVPTTVRPAS